MNWKWCLSSAAAQKHFVHLLTHFLTANTRPHPLWCQSECCFSSNCRRHISCV